jgi:hypothetical protein
MSSSCLQSVGAASVMIEKSATRCLLVVETDI